MCGNRCVETVFTHTNVYDDILENNSDYLVEIVMSLTRCLVGAPCPAYYEKWSIPLDTTHIS